jgi:hypothetical protein
MLSGQIRDPTTSSKPHLNFVVDNAPIVKQAQATRGAKSTSTLPPPGSQDDLRPGGSVTNPIDVDTQPWSPVPKLGSAYHPFIRASHLVKPASRPAQALTSWAKAIPVIFVHRRQGRRSMRLIPPDHRHITPAHSMESPPLTQASTHSTRHTLHVNPTWLGPNTQELLTHTGQGPK